MNITIHSSFLPHDDPEESLAFYRDALGFEVRLDVGKDKMRWITVGPPNQPDTAVVLYPPTATPGITDDERRAITEMMAKGTFGTLLLATKPRSTDVTPLARGVATRKVPSELG
jgi:catechol 2,3-dioxygenase-like lactoylglutathione lyase family enzyme